MLQNLASFTLSANMEGILSSTRALLQRESVLHRGKPRIAWRFPRLGIVQLEKDAEGKTTEVAWAVDVPHGAVIEQWPALNVDLNGSREIQYAAHDLARKLLSEKHEILVSFVLKVNPALTTLLTVLPQYPRQNGWPKWVGYMKPLLSIAYLGASGNEKMRSGVNVHDISDIQPAALYTLSLFTSATRTNSGTTANATSASASSGGNASAAGCEQSDDVHMALE